MKKSNSDSTIYFYEYSKEIVEWDDIVNLLQKCHLMQVLDEKDIYCVAIECYGNSEEKGKLVGVIFDNGTDYISLVPQEYSDLDFFLKELAGG